VRRLAHDALGNWDLRPSRVAFGTESFNTVFRVADLPSDYLMIEPDNQ
jgi:hypothetical protein